MYSAARRHCDTRPENVESRFKPALASEREGSKLLALEQM